VELGAVSFDYPTPGGWVEMVRSVLPALDEGVALGLLRAAGALDFAVALAVLLPGRIARPALVWAVIWGGATAAARIVANLDAFDGLDTTAYWVSAALRRAPHAGLPLALLLMLRTRPGASREAERAQPEPEGAETSAAPSGAVAPDTRQGNPSRVCFRAFLPSVRKAVHRGGSVRPSLSAAS